MNTNIHVFLKDRGPWLAVLALALFVQGWALASWVKKDTRPLGWDEAIHTRVALDYQDRYQETGFQDLLKPAYFNYPPLYHWLLIPALGAVEDIADAGSLLNFFFLILLVVSVFYIGEHLFDRWRGLSAALFVGFYPILAFIARFTLIDVALTALVALNFLCLLKSQAFQNRVWSVLFGVTLGLSMMTKWTGLAYVLFPLLYCVCQALRDKQGMNVVLALGVFGLVIFPWYAINFVPMLARILKVSSLPPASGLAFDRFLNWFWYPFALVRQINIVFLVLFIPGLWVAFKRRDLWPVLLWLGGSLFLFSLIGNRNIRYSMPALPAVALLTVAWFPVQQKKILVGLNALAFLLFFGFQSVSADKGNFSLGPVPITLFPAQAPQQEDWKHEDIIQTVQRLRNPEAPLTRVLTLANNAPFHSTTLNLSRRKKGLDQVAFRGPSKRRVFEFYEFVLHKTGHLGPAFTLGRIQKWADFVQNPADWFGRVFKEVARWPLPDGSEAVLYQARPDPYQDMNVGLFNLSLDSMELARIKAEGVEIQAVPYSPEWTALGKLKEMTFRCQKVHYKRLTFENVAIRLVEPHINLPLFFETQDIEFLSLKEIQPMGKIPAASLLQYARKKLDWLKEPRVEFTGPAIQVQGRAGGIPLTVNASVQIQEAHLQTRVQRLRVGPLSLPLTFVRSVTDRSVPLTPNKEMPFSLGIRSFDGKGDQLLIQS